VTDIMQLKANKHHKTLRLSTDRKTQNHNNAYKWSTSDIFITFIAVKYG